MVSFILAVSVLSSAFGASPPLSYKDVKDDISKLLVANNPIWPFDEPTTNSYGPLMIRHAWHCAGTYRISDGKGGCDGARQRFEPERSWEDNTNLDKAKLLLIPIKEKYGSALSWGDLIILAGTTAIEDMGGPRFGFCGGRIDDRDGTESQELGPTPSQRQYAPCPVQGNCPSPLGSTTLGLVYVNPAGPQGIPDPVGSAKEIRDVFSRMGMNDSETVALIGGGHAFGKSHGACPLGPGPAPDVDPNNPWPGLCGNGKGNWTYTSGFEGPWTKTPTVWGREYFENLVTYEYEVVNGSGGKPQWRQKNPPAGNEKLAMLTSDIALMNDANYTAWVNEYYKDIKLLEGKFGESWYKLVTRDMGPVTRCLGDLIPPAQDFQYPLPDPPSSYPFSWDSVRASIRALMTNRTDLLPPDSRLDKPVYYGAAFTTLAWQCASTFRKSDYLGGCNGARIRFPPQINWPENEKMAAVFTILEPLHSVYKNLSYADLIVLAAQVALEDTTNFTMASFCPGRTDAPDGEGSRYLEGYNYTGLNLTASQIFIHRNNARGLTLREAVALQGRPRSRAIQLARGYRGTWGGNSTVLSNEFFQILLDPSTTWTCDLKDECKSSKGEVYMTTEDLAIKWEPALYSIAEEYANNNTLFLMEFSWAWNRLVTMDRFKGPTDNLCHPVYPPAPTPAPAPAALNVGAIVGAGVGGLLLGALIVFIALRACKHHPNDYQRAT